MRNFFSILLFTSAIKITAQDFSVSVTASQRTARNNEMLSEYCGKDATGYFAFGQVGGVNCMMKLNADMSMARFEPVDKNVYNPKKYFFSSIHEMGNTIWLFTNTFDPHARSLVLCASQVNKDSLTVTPGAQVLTRSVNINVPLYSNTTTSYAFSPDGKKLLLYYKTADGSRTDQAFYLKVLDDSLNLYWEKEIHTFFPPDNCELAQVKVDNEGRVYFLVRKNNFAHHSFISEYHLFILRDKGTFVKDVLLETGNEMISDCAFDVTANGTVRISGFYNEGEEGYIDGTFFLELEKSGYMQSRIQLNPFSSDLLKDFGNKVNDTLVKMQDIFPVIDVHADDRGGITMISERSFANKETYFTNDNSLDLPEVRTEYHEELFIFHYDSSASLLWQDIISKDQNTSLKHMQNIPVRYFYSGNDLFLFYNDQVHDDQNSYGYSSGMVSIAKIDSAGKIFIHDLQPALPHETLFLPYYTYRTGENEFLLFCCENFYLRRVKVVLN
ncbi:MAG: hypothetical protein HY064_15430 [Bacteroidetes bacterium]|nr:hypothetical protein [Bacteroidota bacterium]